MKRSLIVLSATAAVAVAAVGVSIASTDKVLVTVNGTPITEAKLERNLAQLPPFLLEQKGDEIRDRLLDKLVEQELILQEASRMKVRDDKEFKEQLSQIENQLLYTFVLKKKLDKELTDEILRKEYETAKATQTKPSVKARHILVKTEEEARAAIKRLEKGEAFDALARELSTGPSAPKGGDLGWFAEGDMVKPFADAAFSLKKGTYSKDPVKTDFGWHIILTEDKAMRAPSFEEMEENLRQGLSQKLIGEYLSQMKEKADIKHVAK